MMINIFHNFSLDKIKYRKNIYENSVCQRY